MLFQRKNSFAVQELRQYLLLDTDQDVISWLNAYKLPFEIDNGKLMLDKLPPLAGRGPGAEMSQQFLQKAQGMSSVLITANIHRLADQCDVYHVNAGLCCRPDSG